MSISYHLCYMYLKFSMAVHCLAYMNGKLERLGTVKLLLNCVLRVSLLSLAKL